MGMEEKQPIAAFGCRWDDDTLRYAVEDTVNCVRVRILRTQRLKARAVRHGVVVS